MRVHCDELDCPEDCIEKEYGGACVACGAGEKWDGTNCTKLAVPSCATKPCYEGVKCFETKFGIKCGACPEGYDGNGFYCEKVSILPSAITVAMTLLKCYFSAR